MELLKFIRSHENWEELLTAEPYTIKISRDDNYILFKYNQLTSDFSNTIVKECRGLILRESDFKPVCVPFYKFMNAEEPYSDLYQIDWLSASVQEKVDGSLMKVWFDNGWHISTNGTIDAFKAELTSLKYKSFGALFIAAVRQIVGDEHKFFELLNPTFTYMFELVSPENRVVIPYENLDLYFLGVRSNATLYEYMPESGCFHKLNKLFKIPKRFPLYSYNDVVSAAGKLPWDEEGYVVCDANFNRCKVKSPEYVKVHHLSNNKHITAERLVNLVLENEVDELLSYYSEYAVQIDLIKTKLAEFKQNVYNLITEINPNSFASRKEYAEVVKTKPNKYQMFLFKYNDLENQFNKVSAAKWVELLELK